MRRGPSQFLSTLEHRRSQIISRLPAGDPGRSVHAFRAASSPTALARSDARHRPRCPCRARSTATVKTATDPAQSAGQREVTWLPPLQAQPELLQSTTHLPNCARTRRQDRSNRQRRKVKRCGDPSAARQVGQSSSDHRAAAERCRDLEAWTGHRAAGDHARRAECSSSPNHGRRCAKLGQNCARGSAAQRLVTVATWSRRDLARFVQTWSGGDATATPGGVSCRPSLQR